MSETTTTKGAAESEQKPEVMLTESSLAELYPDGEYKWIGRAKSWGAGKTNNGKTQLLVSVEGLTSKGARWTLDKALYFTSSASGQTLEALLCMGAKFTTLDELRALVPKLMAGEGSLGENEFKATISIGSDSFKNDAGEDIVTRRAELQWINPVGRFRRVDPTEADVVEATQALEAAFMARKANGGRRPAPTMPSNGGKRIEEQIRKPDLRKDDDIPF